MNSQLSLREAYNQKKAEEKQRELHEVRTLVESSVLIVEKLDTATISKIVDAMNGVETALSSVLGKLPSLKTALDKAEQELTVLVSGGSWYELNPGNNPKKTGKMLAKAMSFYQNLTSFLRQDLPVLLKSRIVADARATPDQPVGPKVVPAFIQALKINWGNRQGGFFKKLFAGSDVPYLDNNAFAQELSNLSFKELEELTKVTQVPGVLTQDQVNQVAAHLTSPGNPPQTPPVGPGTSSNDAGKKAAIAKALEPYMGSKVPPELLGAIIKATSGVK